MVDMAEGRILTAKSDETIMREAEVLALRTMADNLAAMTREMASYREAFTSMREDMAVIKERQSHYSDQREKITHLQAQVDSIELRLAEQTGGAKAITALKDFGPWVFSIIAGVFILVQAVR